MLDSLYNRIHDNAIEHYHAFYSSELQGIITDPAFMVVHMDDHLVHRGHAVFDTAVIVDGFLYQLWEHLQRFQASAETAGILLPFSIDQIQRIICETAAASRQVNGEPPAHMQPILTHTLTVYRHVLLDNALGTACCGISS